MFLAIVQVEDNRITKYQDFALESDADVHVAGVLSDFPNAFVYETDESYINVLIDNGVASISPPVLPLDVLNTNVIAVNQEQAGALIAEQFGTVEDGFTATSVKLQNRITKNQAEFSALALKVALGTDDQADLDRLAVLGALKDNVFAIQDAENAAKDLINDPGVTNQSEIDNVSTPIWPT